MENHMNNTILDEEISIVPKTTESFAKYSLKMKHLHDINKKITMENEQLRLKHKEFQKQKMAFFKNYQNQSEVITALIKDLQAERKKNEGLQKKNEELLANILLNEQMGIEMKKQFDFYLHRYEEKILQLRQNLQYKQMKIQTLQQNSEKLQQINLPFTQINTNRYTSKLQKYELLIEDMVQERNKSQLIDLSQVNNFLKQFEATQINLNKKKNNKSQFAKSNPSNTETRPSLKELNSDQIQYLKKQKIDIIFLRLHLELRQLKRKHRKMIEENIELRTKDQVMKSGYHMLTKQMEKVKVENCQLKIKLQHLDKKIKTLKQIPNTKSVSYISKLKCQQENAQSKVMSDVSIQDDFSSDANQLLKVIIPSQTKYGLLSQNKSHIFDQKIQNIERISSMDSQPDFANMKNKKLMIKNEEQLSICQQNEVDMSISLDTSGFLAPKVLHHQIDENILDSLVDQNAF